MRFLTRCLVCSGTSFLTCMESTFSGGPEEAARHFLAHRQGLVRGRIQRCQDCGFTFTNPQFSSEEYNEIYRNAPRPHDSDISLDAADARRFSRLAKFVRKDVGSCSRFLDFGCGSGGFLAAMNDPAGVGFEVGDPGVHEVGPSKMVTGNFLDIAGGAGFEKSSFDLIASFNVFEHLPDLDKYVEVLRTLLKPRGHLVITVPDVGTWSAKLARERWSMYLLEHLWYFNKKTLRAFMARAGFQETQRRSVPYSAPVAHIMRRAAQIYGFPAPKFSPRLSNIVFPVPIGLVYVVFKLGG
jgi:SAM-dependent methyltransferase